MINRVKTFFILAFLLLTLLALELFYLVVYKQEEQGNALETKTLFVRYVSFADLSLANSLEYRRIPYDTMFDIYGIDATFRENKHESFVYSLTGAQQ